MEFQGFRVIGLYVNDISDDIKKEMTPETNYINGLKVNTGYSFFDCFKIIDSNTIEYDASSDLSDFYETDNLITISSIVGGNGSGKSSLLELMYRLIYNMSVEVNLFSKSVRDQANYTNSQENIDASIYFQRGSTIYRIDVLQLVIEIGAVQICSQELAPKMILDNCKNITKGDFKDIFYSVSNDYSSYGLNSIIKGDWVKKLFHKNDAYQVPLVLTPMRDNGNYNINRERSLNKSRLLTNQVFLERKYRNKQPNLFIDYSIKHLLYSRFNTKKITFIDDDNGVQLNRFLGYLNIDNSVKVVSLVKEVIKTLYPDADQKKLKGFNSTYSENVCRYVLKKIHNIYLKYPHFEVDNSKFFEIESVNRSKVTIISFGRNESEFKNGLLEFCHKIKSDHSHITLKLRQALNYLIHQTIDDKTIEGEPIKINELDTFSKINSPKNEIYLSESLPPSVFEYDIILNNSNGEEVLFESLSSGEKQLVYTINTVLYHLNNINSTFKNEEDDLIKYKNVFIVFDEVELYFHPEFQRKYIKELINSINKHDITNIKGIHLMFVTHSPFILSDLPLQNILHLEKGEPKEKFKQTFGSNIYDILQDSFFLDGVVGEFASKKINDLASRLKEKDYVQNNKEIQERDFKLISLLEEGIVKKQLQKLYKKAVIGDDLDERISILEKELEALKSKRNNT